MEFKDEGNRLFQQGDWNKAIEQYTAGLNQETCELPADARGLLLSNRSQCWLNLGQWESALKDADGCLQFLPEHTKSFFRRALAREKLGKTAEALADYVRVVKVDPKNRVAAEGAKRLREQLLRSGEQKSDELLPGHLLSLLRDHISGGHGQGCSQAEAADACVKLRGLCVHRGSAGCASLLQAGAVEVLVETSCSADVAGEVRGEALAALFALVSGHETPDEEDAAPGRGFLGPGGPGQRPVSAACSDARRRVHCSLRLAEVRKGCRGEARGLRYLALVLGFCHEPEESEALEGIHDALVFVGTEADSVARAGVAALATMCDLRRSLGKQGKPLVPSEALLKCLESALGTTAEAPLQSLMATAFALLADTDRPKGQEVDLPALGLRILEPFLQEEREQQLRSNGLLAFSALLAVDLKAGVQLLQQSPAPLLAVVRALKQPSPGAEGRVAQDHAAECLLLATGDLKTRQHLIDSGAIDTLLKALGDGEECSKGLMRAKVVAVLAIIAGHNREVREEVFDRLDFLLELREALERATEERLTSRPGREAGAAAAASAAAVAGQSPARRLLRGLYESCACLTIHGEFKAALFAAKRTLQAMMSMVKPEELEEDPQLSFLFSSIVYNLCRSREDKVRPKKSEFPFSELDDEDLNAIEEFYDRMPAEARPAKNGEVDAGSRELAESLRAWCVRGPGPDPNATASGALPRLCRCAASGSQRAQQLVALSLRLLCADQGHRRFVAGAGCLRALLGLVDLGEEPARDAARQALAQILIVTNPALLQYGEQLDSVRPLVEMLGHRHELLQFEGTMALTNLLTVSEELRSRALQAGAWQACRDLLFIENELVQRAGLEAMCNLTMASEVLERFASGRAELEIKVFIGFCQAEDAATRIAASGALAMLAGCEEVAAQIAGSENFQELLSALAASEEPGLQHRLTAAVCGICEASASPPEAARQARSVLQAKRAKGFASPQALDLACSLLEESIPSAGGA